MRMKRKGWNLQKDMPPRTLLLSGEVLSDVIFIASSMLN